mgnify:CR=1 FL=1
MIKEINIVDKQSIYTLGKELNPKYISLYDIDEVLKDKNQIIYGYYEDNIIIGFIHLSVSFDEADIINIIVQEQYRNQGIGSSLISHSIKENKLQKLNLEVKESNNNAIKFYENLGFKKIRIIKNYYGNENAFFMVKML